MARGPIASERLERLPDGRISYEFKRPWHDGTSRVIFSSLEFLEKLVALVPRPRANTVRYHGVLGPAATWRPEVIPSPTPEPAAEQPADAPPCRSSDAAPSQLCLGRTHEK